MISIYIDFFWFPIKKAIFCFLEHDVSALFTFVEKNDIR